MSGSGKIIVIDGLDGSGKSTQLDIVRDMLVSGGENVETISFPDYESDSSAPVRMYLHGEIAPKASDVNAYAASSFYAIDRYISYKTKWENKLNEGKTILSARYVSSNAIHQMVKLPESEWDGFLAWIFDYEHKKLGIPEADLTIFLDMPPEVSQKLLSERYHGDESKKDIHEADRAYLMNCRRAALFSAEHLGWKVISCAENGDPLPIEAISAAIMKEIKEGKICLNSES